jgi:hypothetical protein
MQTNTWGRGQEGLAHFKKQKNYEEVEEQKLRKSQL